MTACVLVEHPIPTSEAKGDLRCDRCGASASLPLGMSCSDHRPVRRTVTVGGPVWVVLNGVPCPDCGGVGRLNAPWHARPSHCPTCNGLGLVAPSWDGPTLLAEWQCIIDGDVLPWCGVECNKLLPPNEAGCERRQVIQWKAHDKQVLPVVADHFGTMDCIIRFVCNGLTLFDFYDHTLRLREPLDEPWAASLRPGQWVVRFDGLEAVTPAITEHLVPSTDVYVSTSGHPLRAMRQRVPLDLEPGVVNHIEIA